MVGFNVQRDIVQGRMFFNSIVPPFVQIMEFLEMEAVPRASKKTRMDASSGAQRGRRLADGQLGRHHLADRFCCWILKPIQQQFHTALT